MIGDQPERADDAGGRDLATGRFLPGNVAGKGNPQHRKVAGMRRALADHLERDLPAVAQALVERAVAGDVQAARVVFERALGQPRPAPAEVAELDLGPMGTLDEIVDATARLARAVVADEVDAQRGQELLGFLSEARAAVEAKAMLELEARLRRLEDAS